ncbi:MAG: hypothetical protein R2741_06035 [Methanolobus sp.]
MELNWWTGLRGVEKKELGSNLQEEFDNLANVWNCLDCTMPASDDETNRVIWKCGNSKLCGNVATSDLKKFVCPRSIEAVDVIIPENTCFMDLVLSTINDATIVMKSRDYSIILAIYGCLNKKEDTQMRIMFCFYLGFTDEKDILEFLQIPVSFYDKHCQILVQKRLLDWKSRELTNEGLNLVHRKLIGDISILFDWTCFEYKSENFRKIEKQKKECAKKKILDILHNKHMKKAGPQTGQ